jgi:hypothetical protein
MWIEADDYGVTVIAYASKNPISARLSGSSE